MSIRAKFLLLTLLPIVVFVLFVALAWWTQNAMYGTAERIIQRQMLPLVNEGDALYHVASFQRPERVADGIGEGVRQDLPQPRGRFRLVLPAELIQTLVGPEQCLLDHVRRVELAPEPGRQLQPGEQAQVFPMPFQVPPSALGSGGGSARGLTSAG